MRVTHRAVASLVGSCLWIGSVAVVSAAEPPQAVTPPPPAVVAPPSITVTTDFTQIISFGVGSAEANPTTAAKSEPATHRECKRVVLRGDGGAGSLQTFCMSGDGRLYGLVAKSFYDGAAATDGGEVHVLDADGKEAAKWKVDFTPQRIAAASDGAVYLGGSGKLARYSADGAKQLEVESPHVAAVLSDKVVLRQSAEEQKASTIKMYEEQLKSFDEQIKTFEDDAKKQAEANPKDENGAKAEPKKKASSGIRFFGVQIVGGGAAEKVSDQQIQQYKQLQKTYREMLEREQKRTIEDVERDIAARLQRIHGIAVGGDVIFVATAMDKGYGYAVWRMTREFGEPKQIITGLSGCCGQIDIQVKNDALFVAENSRHRVVKYDRDGKRLDAWGKREREGDAGSFGGCCNPMNLCFMPDGNVVTAESEGRMKCFSPDGKYAGLVGNAKVGGGCKNVAVAVSPDGKHAYFYDQQGSQIIIFDRADSTDEPQKAADGKQVSLQ